MSEKLTEYYVNNPTNRDITVGDTVVPAYRTDVLVKTTPEHATKLFADGWEPRRRHLQTENFVDQALYSIPVKKIENDPETGEYEFVLSDAGKLLVATNVNFKIPTDKKVNFPNGTVISIFSKEGNNFISPVDDEVTQLVVNGSENTGSYWLFNETTLVTLTKIDDEYWFMSGPGIELD